MTAGLAMPVASSTSTEGPRVEAFFERYLRHANDINSGEPFVLEDWQRDFVHEMFRLDEHGHRIWKRVVLGIPARNGKSAIAAGLVLYFLAFDEVASNPCVLVGAASGDQAGVVFNLADTYVRTNSTLRRRLVVTPSRGLIRFKGHRLGRVQRVNSEAGNLYGKDASFVVLDEVHEAGDDVYTALYSRMGSRKEPMMLLISTAGGNKQGILGRLHDEALANWEVEQRGPCLFVARDYASRTLFWWYGAPDDADIDDPEIWNGCNPASWRTEERLAEDREACRVNEAAFRKYNLNQWASGDGALLPHGTWDSCRNAEVELETGDEVVIGVDSAKNRDHAAVAVVGPEKKGQRPVKVFVFEPEEGQYMPRQAKQKVRELAAIYDVESVAFDPTYFSSEAIELDEAGLTMVQVDQATKRMSAATEKFRTLAFEKKLAHDGDPVLAAHIANCEVRESVNGLRIEKRGGRRSRKIDAAAALIFACSEIDDSASEPFLILA